MGVARTGVAEASAPKKGRLAGSLILAAADEHQPRAPPHRKEDRPRSQEADT
jgi:hypothetical protein